MYRIVNVTEDMLKWHWEALFERTQKLMEDFRDGNLTIEGKVGKTNVIKYIYKVCPDSPLGSSWINMLQVPIFGNCYVALGKIY